MSCFDKFKKCFCLSSFIWFGSSFTLYWFVPHFPCDKIYLLVNISYDILSTKPISRASAFFLNDLQLFLSYLLLFLPPLKNQKQKFDQHRIIYFPNYPGNEDEAGCLILCEQPLLLSMVNTPRGPFNLTSLSLSLCLQVSHNWMIHHCSSHISVSL